MPCVERSTSGPIAILRLNRPAVRNTISNDMLAEIEQHLDAIEAGEARAVIITGDGRGFCAGTDLKEMTAMGLTRYLERVERVHDLFERLRGFRCVSIAAVHGAALGGGTELAAACTFRIATPEAVFGLPEIRLGVMPSYGGTQLVSRLIGENRALEMMLTGRQVGAHEAQAIGLINRICAAGEEIVEAAGRFAEEICHFSQIAQQGIRRCSAVAFDEPLEVGMAIEREYTRSVFASADAEEGVAAFLQKRPPQFTDR